MLDTIPGFFSNDLRSIPDFFCSVSKVCVCGNQLLAGVVFPVPGFAHNQDIVSAPERVSVKSNWLEDYFTLTRHRLVGTTAIVVPLRKISYRVYFAVKHACFGPESDSRAINPNILCNHFAVLLKVKKLFGVLVVKIFFLRDHRKTFI